ncbi:MAG: hypothetical protein QXK06_03180 [Candidatus Diapherotrites archaeon]
MAEKKNVSKKPKKAKGLLEEINTKIQNNRKRAYELNKKFEKEIKEIAKKAKDTPKNSKKIKALEIEAEKARKQERSNRRRLIKIENKLKNAVDDLNIVKTMQLKDFEQLKRKVNDQGDYMAKESARLNEVIDSLKSGIAKTGTASTISKITVAGKKVSGGNEMGNEDIAIRLTSLYFQEVARTGFKKSLTLSEIINAYQYVLGRLEAAGTTPQVPATPVKETIIKQETVSKDAENLMKDIEKLKASIDSEALEKLPEKKASGFAYTNKKGVTYYLHKKGKLFFFSKDPMNAIDKPADMYVVENKQTGLPLVKRK